MPMTVSVLPALNLSVNITQILQVQTSSKFLYIVVSGRSSVLLWLRCNTLCTSGFMDGVMFSHYGDANRTHAYSDSPRAKSDIYDRLVRLKYAVMRIINTIMNKLTAT